MFINPHWPESWMVFIVALLAVILYRFIPKDKLIRLDDLMLALIPGMTGTVKNRSAKKRPSLKVTVRTSMMVIVSILVLVSSLYSILSQQYDAGTREWAFGAIGTILGFWLRGK